MRILYLSLILLVSCSTPLVDPTPINNETHIKWVRHKDLFELEKACVKVAPRPNKFFEYHGCATFNLKTKECIIHTLNPQEYIGEDMAYLGHEVKHCFDGNFHK